MDDTTSEPPQPPDASAGVTAGDGSKSFSTATVQLLIAKIDHQSEQIASLQAAISKAGVEYFEQKSRAEAALSGGPPQPEAPTATSVCKTCGGSKFVEVTYPEGYQPGFDDVGRVSPCPTCYAPFLRKGSVAEQPVTSQPVADAGDVAVADAKALPVSPLREAGNDLLLSDAIYLEGLAFVRTGAEASRLTAIAYRIRSALVATPPSPKLGAAVHAAALVWCGEKERETFPEDIEYFKQNWRSLPGLTAYVHRELGREALSQLEKSRDAGEMG